MNRRNFFKLISVAPLAPSVLAAMPVAEAGAKDFEKYDCFVETPQPDPEVYIDYYRVQQFAKSMDKLHFEIRWREECGNWQLTKRTLCSRNVTAIHAHVKTRGFLIDLTPMLGIEPMYAAIVELK